MTHDFAKALPLDSDRLLSALEAFLGQEIAAGTHDGASNPAMELTRGLIHRKLLIAAAPGMSEQTGADKPLCKRVSDERDALAGFEAVFGTTGSASADADDDATAIPDTAKITAWLQERFPQEPGIRAQNVVQAKGGYSKQTVFFETVNPRGNVEALVMRRDIPGGHVESTVRDEYPWLLQLFAAGLPVPEPVLLEEHSAEISGRFLITRRVRGGNIGNHLSVQRDLGFNPARALAQSMAQLHTYPLDRLKAEGLPDGSINRGVLLDRITYWRDRYRAMMEVRSDALDVAFNWLVENVEIGLQDPSIVHGEAGFHNMLFDGSRVSVLLDWEFVHVGNPAWDLVSLREHVTPFGSFDDFLREYAAAGGRVPDERTMDFYEIFWRARTAVLCLTGVSLFNRGEHQKLEYLNISWRLYPGMICALANTLAKVAF